VVVDVIDKTPEKRKLSPEKIEILRKMKVTAEYEKNGPDKMLIEQALSLRKQMLVDKIIANGGRMKRLGDRMREAYEKGHSLTDLCIRYECGATIVLIIISITMIIKILTLIVMIIMIII
jgi:hypothetical protein